MKKLSDQEKALIGIKDNPIGNKNSRVQSVD